MGFGLEGGPHTEDRRFHSPTSAQLRWIVKQSSTTCQVRDRDQYIIKDAWNLVSTGNRWDVVGGTTFPNESLNEHAAGPTAPSPNHESFSNSDYGHDGIVCERGHLDPVSVC